MLPGGNPRAAEGAAACARREIAEETGLAVDPQRVAFVLEASNREAGDHTIEIVFFGRLSDPRAEPEQREFGLYPVFMPLDELNGLDVRPPITGHLRGLHARRGGGTAAYLGNVWRPRRVASPSGATVAGATD